MSTQYDTQTEPATLDDDTGRFVPSTGQWVAMLLALAFLAGAVGFAWGSRADSVPGERSMEVGFLQDMISHHEQAVRMANLQLVNGAERDVRVFAREILHQQSYEIGVMDLQLERWGYTREERPAAAMEWMGSGVPVDEMPGMASPDEMVLLETRAGREVDALFIPLMRDHHLGGIHMAEHAAEHSSSEFVRDLARRMARAQTVEITEMALAQRRLALPTQPEGYEPAPIPSGRVIAGEDDHEH